MKEKISILIDIFTRVVAGILFFSVIYSLIVFGSNARLLLSDIFGILLIGFISAVAYIPFLRKKEISKKAMLFLNVIYFLVINISVFIIGFVQHWFLVENKKTIIGLELTFVSVYIIVMVVSFIIDVDNVSRMNELLKKRQENNKNNDDL